MVSGIAIAAHVQNNGNNVTVRPDGGQAKVIRLEVVNDNIIRVRATSQDDLPEKPASLMIVPQVAPVKGSFSVSEETDNVVVKAKNVKAVVAKATGEVTFFDANGNQLLKEAKDGKMFKDFEAEYEGKVTKLSDYVGKGKYVLVDFWASWCGPCRMEIPNLIAVYNKYKGEKFEVLGVATWDEPDATKQAIEELGIPYPQILNAQKAGSDAYGISGIPQIILFAPDGKIVKRDLRGEAIEKAVADVLK